MKLSEKGFEKIAVDFDGDHDQWDDYQFEQSDFRDCIVLSVKDAEAILSKLQYLSEEYFLQTGNIDNQAIEWIAHLTCLIDDHYEAEREVIEK